MTTLPFLAEFEPEHIGIFIPIIGIAFGCSIAIVAIISKYRSRLREEELWHQTARVALEKGQPLPPRIEAELTKPASSTGNGSIRARNDLRTGLILISLGAGLFFALGGLQDSSAYFSAIPAFIGVALLLNAAIEGLAKRSQAKAESTTKRL